ncbi:hypothetical protein Pan216_30070 [Planctomycetes bacterium Pan216]|uniref:Uncharacterized protein n=1 Tax=Kolteria novifilia TaxID=2527975 RepID=A0A518B585_9BACT|nr:hypothetical protein Pan216_30070 [Planctomycetes bacterium Pan216]
MAKERGRVITTREIYQWGLDQYALYLYLCIHDRANFRVGNRCRLNTTELASGANCSPRRALKAKAELVDRGLIRVIKPKLPNQPHQYELLEPAELPLFATEEQETEPTGAAHAVHHGDSPRAPQHFPSCTTVMHDVHHGDSPRAPRSYREEKALLESVCERGLRVVHADDDTHAPSSIAENPPRELVATVADLCQPTKSSHHVANAKLAQEAGLTCDDLRTFLPRVRPPNWRNNPKPAHHQFADLLPDLVAAKAAAAADARKRHDAEQRDQATLAADRRRHEARQAWQRLPPEEQERRLRQARAQLGPSPPGLNLDGPASQVAIETLEKELLARPLADRGGGSAG